MAPFLTLRSWPRVLGLSLVLFACSESAPPRDNETSAVDGDDDDESDEPDDDGVRSVDAGKLDGGMRARSDAAASARMDASTIRAPDAGDARVDASADAQVTTLLDGGAPPKLSPIEPPVPDDCITNVRAGDHTFTCSGITFLVKVDEACTRSACGLIFDVHGATMSGTQMRDNTKLHELAPPLGYIVVHPSATPSNTGGTWDLTADPPKIADFFLRMIKAFHVDPARIHVTGFSQGSAVTFYFLCKHPELLASAAPLSGQSADVSCINESWKPRVPFLFMSGTTDSSLAIATARERVDGFVRLLGLQGGEQIEGDGHYFRKRWQGSEGMVFDYMEHDYGGQAVLAGHCVPGGTDVPGAPNNFVLNATTCTTGDIKVNWGRVALQWFVDHPKQR